MRIKRVTFSNFMRYGAKPVDVDFPDAGLVLVTGLNGAGKSALMEAVSFGGWGKTIRGTDPRREAEAGGLQLVTAFGMQVDRAWSGKPFKTVLRVSHEEADRSFDFENAQKAQDHVTSVLGEWDTWRRSCAFSSVDDLSFATATDAERKRLLEGILGLQRFDQAQARCRVDARTVLDAAQGAERALARAESALEVQQRSVAHLEQVASQAAPAADAAGTRARLEALEGLHPIHVKKVESEQAAADATRQRLDAHLSEERRLQAEVAQLGRSTHCPTCEQAWPDAAAREAKKDAAAKKLEGLLANRPKSFDATHLNHARQSLSDSTSAIAKLKAELVAAEKAAAQHEAAQRMVDEAKLKLLEMEDDVQAFKAEAASRMLTYRHLEVVDDVLGTKGARAHMLYDALTSLELIANAWLEEVAREDAPLKLKLSPYTERKAGGQSDSISLEVEGAGGGRGYRAASGGERRRIDVALMLALADVAQRTAGVQAPTTFFDEVFDALDAHGREAVAGVLERLSRDRCVVLMTHSVELLDHMSGVRVMHLHVEDGRLERR